MTIINYLRSPAATLIVLCSALLAQLPHAADVFRLIVMGDGLWSVLHSYTYAIALELAVLLFVVQRRNVESYIFAVVSILVNLSYYALHDVQLFSVAALPAWLVSIALPAAIAQYSHLIAAATDAHDDATDAQHDAPATPAPAPLHLATLPPAQGDAPATGTDAAHDAPATPATPATLPALPADAPAPDGRTRAMQLRSEGYTAAEIAKMLDAKYSTVQSWLRRATVQVNGGTQL